jgi:hypothetical protein
MHLRVLAQVSLNALLIFSSSSEYDTKIVRRMKDAKMQYPMAGKGIVALLSEWECLGRNASNMNLRNTSLDHLEFGL